MPDRVVKYSVLFIALVLAALVLQTLQNVLRPLAISALLLFVTTPLARASREKGIPPWITFGGMLVLLVLLLSYAGSFLHVDDIQFQDAIPKLKERISTYGDGALGTAAQLGLKSVTPERLSQMAADIARQGFVAIRTLISESMLALIFLMFLVQSRDSALRSMKRKGGQAGARFEAVLRKIEEDVVAYFGTKTAISFGTGAVSGIILLLFGAQGPVLTGILIFLLNFIPVIGSLIAVVIAFVIYVVSFGFGAAAGWLLVALMAVQVVFGSILEPKFTSERLNMSPILIMVSLYVWGWIWGITGMFISVPLTILIMVSVKHIGGADTEEGTT